MPSCDLIFKLEQETDKLKTVKTIIINFNVKYNCVYIYTFKDL